MAATPSAGDSFIQNVLHPLFSSKNDSEMFTQMVWISFFYTLSVIISMAIFPAPYGTPFECCFLRNVTKRPLSPRAVQQFPLRVSDPREVCLDDPRVSRIHPPSVHASGHHLVVLELHRQQDPPRGIYGSLHSKVPIELKTLAISPDDLTLQESGVPAVHSRGQTHPVRAVHLRPGFLPLQRVHAVALPLESPLLF